MINNRTNDLSMRLDIIKILKKSHWNEKKTLNESKVLCELNKYKNNSARPPILGPDPSLPAETGSRRRPKRPRTVFHKALDALHMDWEDNQLKKILKCHPRSCFTSDDEKQLSSSPSACSKVNKHGQLLWQEHIPTACARVEALRTHGYTAEALRLSVAIVRTMKHNQVFNSSFLKALNFKRAKF